MMKRILPYVLLVALCCVLFVWRIGSVPLLGLDEGLYATCSREMVESGNYVTPTVNGEPFFDKPPLCYWLQAAGIRVFGVNSFAVRLPSAICGLLLVALTVFIGSRLFGRQAGLIAGFALTASTLTVGLARMAVMDQAFALTITAALGMFILRRTANAPAWYGLIAWFAMGLAVLIKGPAGIALVAAIVGVWAALSGLSPRGLIRPTAVKITGLLLFAAVALPWYVMAHRETGGAFTCEFIIHQNLQRAAGQDFQHNMPFWYYVPIFIAGFFPWSVFVPLAWKWHVKRKPSDARGQAALLAGVWMAVVIGVFSLSRSKLPSYIYPAYPAAALLVGLMWSSMAKSGKAAALRPYVIAAFVCSWIAALAMQIGQRFLPEPIPGLAAALVPMSVSIAVGSLVAVVLICRGRVVPAFIALCCGISGFLLVAALIGLQIAAGKLADPMVEVARVIERSPRSQRALAFRLSPPQPALAFYSKRPVTSKASTAELTKSLAESECALVVAQEGRTDDLPEGGVIEARIGPYIIYRYARL